MGVTMDQGPLRIGEVASAAGVNTQTLRDYERRGILAAPERSCTRDGSARRCPILEALDDAPTRRPRG